MSSKFTYIDKIYKTAKAVKIILSIIKNLRDIIS